MADLAFIVLIVGFFALVALFVTACDRIVGRDEPAPATETLTAPTEPELLK